MKTFKYKIELELKKSDISKVKDVRSYLASVLDGEDFTVKSITKSESIKTRSAKNKGAKFQKWVAEKISEVTGIAIEKDGEIEPRQMGQMGTDVRLSGKAKKLFPFAVECKNSSTFSIPAWVEQAKSNQSDGTDWLLFITKNDYDKLCVLDANVFFNIYKRRR